MKTIIRNFLSVMRRYKMAATLNVLGLSVAFAAFMIIMMQVDFDRTFDRSHKDADKIFRVEVMSNDKLYAIISRPLSDAIIQSSPHITAGTVANLAAELFFSTAEKGESNFYREGAMTVSPSFTDVFTFEMAEGNANAIAEPDKALLPLSLARKLFGNEPAVGKLLHLSSDKRYTVGGVYRDFPRNSSVENLIYSAMPEKENIDNWGNWNYFFFIRLNDAANVDGLFENFKKTFDIKAAGANFNWEDDNRSFRFTSLADLHFTNDVSYDNTPKASRQTVLALAVIAFAILIIAGINYTNFSAALVPKRIRSINTQKVLGGSVRTIRTALLAEAVGICVASWIIALAIVHLFGLSPLVSLVEADVSLMANLDIIAGTAVSAIALGIIAGAYPSFYLTSFPPALALKGSFGLSPKGKALRSLLITVQFVASFALIIGAMFMYLQNRYMTTSPLGYEKEQIVIVEGTESVIAAQDAFRNSLMNLAEVADATSAQFLLSSNDQYMGWGRKYNDKDINYQCLPVTASFLDVMGIEVTEGRSFREEDAKGEHPAAIFNESARIRYEMKVGDKIDDIEIIGFMPDIKFASFRTAVTPMAFHVWGKYVWGQETTFPARYFYVKVKAGSDMRLAIDKIRSVTQSYEGVYPLNIYFYDNVFNRLYNDELKLGRLILLFSLTAIFISIVGVFGLVVFDSEYRRREIAIRKVFGSTTVQILTKFNRNYIRLLFIGFIPAAPLAWYAVDRWMTNFAYKTPMYWWVYLCSFIIISILTVATVTFQNWKAANMNPAESVKE
jgi:putative ABC transport system permease protein